MARPLPRSGGAASRVFLVRVLIGLVALALAGFALLAPAAAHTNAPGNNGTIKIHQSPGEAEPIVRNEPHVSCLFHLHAFFADSGQTGDWWIKAWPPTGDGSTIVMSGSYLTDANGEWRSDDKTLPAGHYKLFWQDPPGANGVRELKHKVFWVDECAQGSGSPGASESAGGSVQASESAGASESPGGSVQASESAGASESPGGSVQASESAAASESPGGSVQASESAGASESPGGSVQASESAGASASAGGSVEASESAAASESAGASASAGGSVAASVGASASTGGGGVAASEAGVTPPNTATDPGSANTPDQGTWRWVVLAMAALLGSLAVTLPEKGILRRRR